MKFLLKNNKVIKPIIVISILADLAASFIINKISADNFDFRAKHNVVLLVVLVVLVILLILCKILETKDSSRSKSKKLQKVFQENGGYDVVVEEMKKSIKQHDVKSIKDLKKIIDIIEK